MVTADALYTLAGYVEAGIHIHPERAKEVAAALRRLVRLEDAARCLVALKDGPRDEAYRVMKEPAWRNLREALETDEEG